MVGRWCRPGLNRRREDSLDALSLSLLYYVLLIEPVVVARWLEFRDIVVCFAKLRNYGSIESDNYGQILDNGKFYSFSKRVSFN